ncbi:ParB/RepB/Spo0J family partition protein [Streptomyces hainanensis]|uniref:ParB/RepB/Spo0J family partition protein n=1 Tax=Streptomyces hainanensis TaxID=402648 RepID=A0A4R4TE07_9ACTN|nr:ParB/RepB/Spo0J family partition protein [Streptomyces hainanensis]TDC73392.1 ParB/RepB/Spo0J family partition protein [Streptomyces hainanensis]
MSERRRGLGRGLNALIPAAPRGADDVEAKPGASTSPGAVPSLSPERGLAVPTGQEFIVGEGQNAVSRETAEPGSVAEAVAAGVGAEVAGAFFAELPLGAITRNPRQPRKDFDDDALAELVTSIKEVGLLQPIVVRQLEPERFELIMGERRFRACTKAGLEVIPAIVRATEDDKMLLDALLENLHRVQLNPLEEAYAYDQLLRDFKCTHDELADRIGRSRPQVSNTLRLLRLSPRVQQRVAAGVLSAGHARALLSVEDAEEQERLAQRIVAEGLSVRAIEEIVMLQGSALKNGARPRKPRAGRRIAPALDSLATRLSDRFETRVKVDLGQKKGKIVVEFASMEDLERILGQLAPGEGPVLDQIRADAPDTEKETEAAG